MVRTRETARPPVRDLLVVGTISLVADHGEEWLTLPMAAKLLGLQLHTVYALIDRGELSAEVTFPPGPKRRRSVRLRHGDVADFLRRARLKPGELRHLVPTVQGRYDGEKAPDSRT